MQAERVETDRGLSLLETEVCLAGYSELSGVGGVALRLHCRRFFYLRVGGTGEYY